MLRDAYGVVAVGGGWRGNGGIRESGIPNRETGGGFGNRGFRIGESGCGKRGAGNGNPEFAESGIRGIRNPETDSELTGVHNCALGSGNSAEFTPGNPPETPRNPPGNPRISK